MCCRSDNIASFYCLLNAFCKKRFNRIMKKEDFLVFTILSVIPMLYAMQSITGQPVKANKSATFVYEKRKCGNRQAMALLGRLWVMTGRRCW